jgi:hypothetical protein
MSGMCVKTRSIHCSREMPTVDEPDSSCMSSRYPSYASTKFGGRGAPDATTSEKGWMSSGEGGASASASATTSPQPEARPPSAILDTLCLADWAAARKAVEFSGMQSSVPSEKPTHERRIRLEIAQKCMNKQSEILLHFTFWTPSVLASVIAPVARLTSRQTRRGDGALETNRAPGTHRLVRCGSRSRATSLPRDPAPAPSLFCISSPRCVS